MQLTTFNTATPEGRAACLNYMHAMVNWQGRAKMWERTIPEIRAAFRRAVQHVPVNDGSLFARTIDTPEARRNWIKREFYRLSAARRELARCKTMAAFYAAPVMREAA